MTMDWSSTKTSNWNTKRHETPEGYCSGCNNEKDKCTCNEPDYYYD